MRYETRNEAVHAWVSEMNRIPTEAVRKIWNHDIDNGLNFEEITPISVGTRVQAWRNGDMDYGDVTGKTDDGNWLVLFDGADEPEEMSADEIEQYIESGYLPMWGWMWILDDTWDEEWARDNLEAVASCGFRIYEEEDLGIVLGIDGAGYDFYSEHWIPLYKARGLRWSKEDE